MAFVTAPDFAISSVDWSLETVSSVNVSAYTGVRTVSADPWHSKWRAKVSLARIQSDDSFRTVRSFFSSLNGSVNTFRLFVSAGSQNSNYGVTVSTTASAGATILSITGAATPLKEGQYFTVNGQLCVCTADQAGSTVQFQPPLRQSAIAGTYVATSRPYALMFLSQPQFGFNIAPARLFTMNFEAEEALLESDGLDPETVPSASLPIGAITLPAVFNNQLSASFSSNGSTVNGISPYDLIDVTGSGTVTNYYVEVNTGLDTNNGLTSGTAFKTFLKATQAVTALAAGSKAIIHLLDDYVDYLSFASYALAAFDGRNVKVKGEGPSGRSKIVGMRRDYDQTAFAWVAHGTNGAWKSNAAAVGNYAIQFFLDGNRIPQPIVSTSQTSATVDTNELTSHWDGTYLYVHLPNGAKPNPFVNWEYSANYGALSLNSDTGSILFENVDFLMSGAGAAFDTIAMRSVTDLDFTSQTRVGFRNCAGYGSSGNIFGLKDMQVIALDNCRAAYAKLDLFNYHTNQSTGTHGEFMTVYEVGCSGHDAGYTGFADGAATSTSSNGSTSHDSMHVLRANASYWNTNGAVVADVNGVVSVNLNVVSLDPTGTASPKACFWHSGTGWGAHYGMYIWGGQAYDNGDATTILLDNSGTPNAEPNGQIYLQHWRGQTSGTIVGTLKDWGGNTLASLADAA